MAHTLPSTHTRCSSTTLSSPSGILQHKGCTFYYRDVANTIAFLLRQRTFPAYLVPELVRDFDDEGNREFTEIHTADRWWQTQVYLHGCKRLLENIDLQCWRSPSWHSQSVPHVSHAYSHLIKRSSGSSLEIRNCRHYWFALIICPRTFTTNSRHTYISL